MKQIIPALALTLALHWMWRQIHEAVQNVVDNITPLLDLSGKYHAEHGDEEIGPC